MPNYHDDLSKYKFYFAQPCQSQCYEKFSIVLIKPVKRVSLAAGARAVGSIRDYYVDPNLTEEDRAVPNSHSKSKHCKGPKYEFHFV